MPDELTPPTDFDARVRRLVDLGEAFVKAYLYFASGLSSVWGFVFGVVLLARCKYQENRKLGTVCIILGVVNTVLVGLCAAAYVVLVAIGMMGILAGAAGGGTAAGG